MSLRNTLVPGSKHVTTETIKHYSFCGSNDRAARVASDTWLLVLLDLPCEFTPAMFLALDGLVSGSSV